MINKINLILLSTLFCTSILAQEYNTVTIDEKTGKPMLIGYTTLEAFNDTSFSGWWNSTFNKYEVDSTAVEKLKVKLEDVDIKIVMGTWCHDSKREVPRFFKILDEISYPTEKVTLITVNRDKQGLENEVEGLDIKLVPTFIFYKNEKELDRIVEVPYESLEQDMLEIISGHSKNEN